MMLRAAQNIMSNSELSDEALTGRLLAAMDCAVTLIEQWNRLSNQELAPPGAARACQRGRASTFTGG